MLRGTGRGPGPSRDPGGRLNSSTGRTLAALYLTTGLIFLTDQATKWAAERWLGPPSLRQVDVIPLAELFRLRYLTNPGAAWGLFPGYTSLFVTVAVVVSVVCLWIIHQFPEHVISWPAAFLLGGGLGNMVDRLVRNTGVVDFIDMGIMSWRWPTFNLADVFLCIGIFWLGKLILFHQLPWDQPGEPAEE